MQKYKAVLLVIAAGILPVLTSCDSGTHKAETSLAASNKGYSSQDLTQRTI